MTTGSCLCGAVQYEIVGPFPMMVHCHCSRCRKHHGTAFASFVIAPLTGLRWIQGEDAIVSYASTAHSHRSFCRHCGSVAPNLMPEAGIAACPAGNLMGDFSVDSQAHIFVGSKAEWEILTDSLPRFDEYPPGVSATAIPGPVRAAEPGHITGSCLCGDVKYEVTGAPTRMSICHCTRCQKARSAGAATNVVYPDSQITWLSGADKIREYKVPEAKFFAVAFCERCGSTVPRISKERGIVVVPAGAFDSDPGIRPQAHIFAGSRAPWLAITDSLPQFPEYPT